MIGGTTDHAVVLTYHHVATDTPASTTISPTQFAGHLDYLDKRGANVMPLQELTDRLQKGLSVPDNTVALTFDDAYASVFTEASKQLSARGWPYTIFVGSGAIDTGHKPYMTWSQLRQLADAGVTIGNHSHSHAHLVRQGTNESKEAWRARITADIQKAQARIRTETGVTPDLFAYPYGEYTAEISSWIKNMGFIGFGQHSGAVGPGSDFTALPRFPLGGNYTSLDQLAVRIAARPLYLKATPVGPLLLNPLTKVDWVTLTIPQGPYMPSPMNCYASNQGLMNIKPTGPGSQVRIRPKQPLRPGRTKFNCTLPHSAGGGVFFWWSYLVMQPYPDGHWYSG